jgi:hypothetical protein
VCGPVFPSDVALIHDNPHVILSSRMIRSTLEAPLPQYARALPQRKYEFIIDPVKLVSMMEVHEVFKT